MRRQEHLHQELWQPASAELWTTQQARKESVQSRSSLCAAWSTSGRTVVMHDAACNTVFHYSLEVRQPSLHKPS